MCVLGSGYNECEYVPVEEQEECLENKNKVVFHNPYLSFF